MGLNSKQLIYITNDINYVRHGYNPNYTMVYDLNIAVI